MKPKPNAAPPRGMQHAANGKGGECGSAVKVTACESENGNGNAAWHENPLTSIWAFQLVERMGG